MRVLVTGAAGLLWVLAWLQIYQRRAAATDDPTPPSPVGLRRLIAQRPIWGLCLARSLTDPVWYFYLFWLPTYLKDVRHFSLAEVGYFAWIPFLASGRATSPWPPAPS